MSQPHTLSFGYKQEIGNTIRIYFVDRRMMTGKLLADSQNELYLEVKGIEVTVFKHAVKYITKDIQ